MKCKVCSSLMINKSRSIPVVERIPFITERAVGQYCKQCDRFTFSPAKTWFFKNELRKWIILEHTGSHVKKRFRKKDHYKYHHAMSLSLLGEAPKGIYSNSQICTKKQQSAHNNKESVLFLFKGPKVKNGFSHGFRETVSEVILNHLAQMITKTASASIGNHKGCLVFITQIFTKQDEQLIHGTEIFKELYDDEGISEIQKDRDAQRKFYSIQHVEEALRQFNPTFFTEIIKSFYKMLFVDAWLGNQDRHAENWGLKKIINKHNNEIIYEFAPLFDTARGIFWNESISTLERKYFGQNSSRNLQKYINTSRPLMSLDHLTDVNHFDIAKYLKDKDLSLFNYLLSLLNSIDIPGAISLYHGTLHRRRLGLICKLLEERRSLLNLI